MRREEAEPRESLEDLRKDADVAVVGGGPAGLAAATWLARFGRRVRVLDTGEPRNAPTWAVHGYPGLPDLPPHELRRRLRDQALGAGAEALQAEVTAVTGSKDAFRLQTASRQQLSARRVLLAFGRRDELPSLTGAAELYGVSLFHCPDCDGPSVAGSSVGVIGGDTHAASLAFYVSFWAGQVALLVNGGPLRLPEDVRRRLEAEGIDVREQAIAQLDAQAGRLREVRLEGGESLPLDCLFFHSRPVPACALAADLGCECDQEGHLVVDAGQETSVPGIFAAGDITGHPYLAASAAAQGVRAALSMHRSLLPEHFRI